MIGTKPFLCWCAVKQSINWNRRWGWGTRLMNLIHNYDFPSPLFFNASIKRNECTKRQATESIHVSEDDSDESFPHFLVVEASDSTPIKHSIFMIQKILQCAVRNAKLAKILRSGAVLVEVTSKLMASDVNDDLGWYRNQSLKVSKSKS